MSDGQRLHLHSDMPDRHLVLRRPWWAPERTADLGEDRMSGLFKLQRPPDWMDAALCAQTGNPDAWFSEKNGSPAITSQARAICFRCPVRQQCMEYAMDRERAGDHLAGMWGGTSANQRVQQVRGERAARRARQQRPPQQGATA